MCTNRHYQIFQKIRIQKRTSGYLWPVLETLSVLFLEKPGRIFDKSAGLSEFPPINGSKPGIKFARAFWHRSSKRKRKRKKLSLSSIYCHCFHIYVAVVLKCFLFKPDVQAATPAPMCTSLNHTSYLSFFYTGKIFGEWNLHRKTPIFCVKSVKKKRHFFA